ncbi:MAG: dihydroorotate dehydrogenase electron transfer subunit [Deltaproteobacteria bacterium]|nr:dihydroorotate dehydrogenase electron transfer subunit [Deltaproteobacteria bacterium]
MIQENVQVLWNKQVTDSCFRIGLNCNPGYSEARPGQFVMLRVLDQLTPLLRRPFSIFSSIKEEGRIIGIEVMYKVVGQGTEILSACKKGDAIDMLGPLGNGFRIPDNCDRLFILAGGIGVPPMYFLASDLKEKSKNFLECEVFLGGRTKEDLFGEDDFEKIGATIHIATDDGSKGEKGFITDLLKKRLTDSEPDMICACGPMEMLKKIGSAARSHGIACQASVETMMACGMGACLGCAVERKDDKQYLHACVDGPVFNIEQIKLIDREPLDDSLFKI